jgi:hypothetical protein
MLIVHFVKRTVALASVWFKPLRGIFLVRYQTELVDAGMPMPALVSLMPMPSYGLQYYLGISQCVRTFPGGSLRLIGQFINFLQYL